MNLKAGALYWTENSTVSAPEPRRQTIIKSLTHEQINSLTCYREKWAQGSREQSAVSQSDVELICQEIYSLLGKKTPEIVFCKSPADFVEQYFCQYIEPEWQRCRPCSSGELEKRIQKTVGTGQGNRLRNLVVNALFKQLNRQVTQALCQKYEGDRIFSISDVISSYLNRSPLGPLQSGNHTAPVCIHQTMQHFSQNCFSSDLLLFRAIWLDFCISKLGCEVDRNHWQVFKDLAGRLQYRVLFPFSNICFVCDAPDRRSLNLQMQLHGDGVPAVAYADGFKLYMHRGIPIPEEYGEVPSELWQPEWLLKERNAEMRRVLIQAIGYERVCRELAAEKVDTWREYQLLRLKGVVEDVGRQEPVNLLKMTCPSTDFIHILRVPPDVTQAREAIRWVNHGIDPEDFAVET